MTPQFANGIDPLFIHVLNMVDRVEAGGSCNVAEERLRILGLFNSAEGKLGQGESWELAKYALAAWIDELLIEIPWEGHEWWRENCLEVEFYNARMAYSQFFIKAKQATNLTNRDALEVFYVCAVLGFQGLYRDPNSGGSRLVIEQNNLPPDFATWTRHTANAIRIGTERPKLDESGVAGPGAPPLDGPAQVLGTILSGIILAALNIIFGLLLYFRS